MTFHPIPNTAQVNMIYDVDGQPCENVYFVAGAGAWDLSMLATLSSDFAGWEADVAAPLRNGNTKLTKIFARDMTSESGAELETDHSIPGTWVGAVVPQNVTISLKAQTGSAGRDRRGRTYWIGMSDNMLGPTAGQVLGGVVASLLTALNALVAVAFPNSGKLVVAHRKVGSAYITPAVTHEILSYTAADHFVDSQRRRLPGHNRHR